MLLSKRAVRALRKPITHALWLSALLGACATRPAPPPSAPQKSLRPVPKPPPMPFPTVLPAPKPPRLPAPSEPKP